MSLGPLSTATILGWVIAITFFAFSFIVVWKIYRDQIDISGILSESATSNKASLSRFQFLLFTYVFTGLYLVLCIEAGSLIEIPNGVLGLLGISAGSYAVSKGISVSAEKQNPTAKPAGDGTNPGTTP